MGTKESRVNKKISMRCKKNFAYFMRYHKQEGTHLDIIFKHRYACIDHIFDDHSKCTPHCPARKAKVNNLPYHPKEPYLDPMMHSDIRTDLKSVIDTYTQRSRLAEVFHQGIRDRGTQHNKVINNSTTTMAPKAPNYTTSVSFTDRISTMIGTHNLGHLKFNTAVYALHGRFIPKFLKEYLQHKDEKKRYRRHYEKEPAVKNE